MLNVPEYSSSPKTDTSGSGLFATHRTVGPARGRPDRRRGPFPAAGQHRAPPGPAPPGAGPRGTVNLGTTCDTRGGPDQRPPPGTRAQDYLRSLRVRLTPIARGRCDHRHAETRYQTSRKLQHLIQSRSTRCSAPGCGRPAARCDLDHTTAWHLGGVSYKCNLAPACKL